MKILFKATLEYRYLSLSRPWPYEDGLQAETETVSHLPVGKKLPQTKAGAPTAAPGAHLRDTRMPP